MYTFHLICPAVQDAYLPQRLLDKLMYMYNYIEMARVTGVPLSFLLTKGQSIKVFSQVLRKARTKNLVVPFMKVRQSCACRSPAFYFRMFAMAWCDSRACLLQEMPPHSPQGLQTTWRLRACTLRGG